MALYQPHQIYTTIAEISYSASETIREYILGHNQKGSKVHVFPNRLNVVTKDGNTLDFPFKVAMSHFLANKYDESVVLPFAEHLTQQIESISGYLDESQNAEFLRLKISMKGIHNEESRIERFCAEYALDSIDNPDYQIALANLVHHGDTMVTLVDSLGYFSVLSYLSTRPPEDLKDPANLLYPITGQNTMFRYIARRFRSYVTENDQGWLFEYIMTGAYTNTSPLLPEHPFCKVLSALLDANKMCPLFTQEEERIFAGFNSPNAASIETKHTHPFAEINALGRLVRSLISVATQTVTKEVNAIKAYNWMGTVGKSAASQLIKASNEGKSVGAELNVKALPAGLGITYVLDVVVSGKVHSVYSTLVGMQAFLGMVMALHHVGLVTSEYLDLDSIRNMPAHLHCLAEVSWSIVMSSDGIQEGKPVLYSEGLMLCDRVGCIDEACLNKNDPIGFSTFVDKVWELSKASVLPSSSPKNLYSHIKLPVGYPTPYLVKTEVTMGVDLATGEDAGMGHLHLPVLGALAKPYDEEALSAPTCVEKNGNYTVSVVSGTDCLKNPPKGDWFTHPTELLKWFGESAKPYLAVLAAPCGEEDVYVGVRYHALSALLSFRVVGSTVGTPLAWKLEKLGYAYHVNKSSAAYYSIHLKVGNREQAKLVVNTMLNEICLPLPSADFILLV